MVAPTRTLPAQVAALERVLGQSTEALVALLLQLVLVGYLLEDRGGAAHPSRR